MKLEWVQQCQDCKGKGLYQGFAERGGAAIVCHACSGTGRQKQSVEYEEFTGRQPSLATWVYATNPGVGVDDIGTVPGGVSISVWEAEPQAPWQSGKEMREHTCPAWWYQGVNYDLKPNWTTGEPQCASGGAFSGCRYFVRKVFCWSRWDKEYREKAEAKLSVEEKP